MKLSIAKATAAASSDAGSIIRTPALSASVPAIGAAKAVVARKTVTPRDTIPRVQPSSASSAGMKTPAV